MKKALLFLHLLTILLVFSVVIQAASVEKLTLSDMVNHSKQIVIGTITNVSSAWNTNHTQIYSTFALDVSECLKGNVSGVLTFTQLGGVAEGIRVSVPGFPVFKKDSEVLLFMSGSKDMPTVGLGQGKFDLFQDESSGEKMVVNDVFGLKTFDSKKPLAENGTIKMSLTDMKQSIGDILDRSTEQKK